MKFKIFLAIAVLFFAGSAYAFFRGGSEIATSPAPDVAEAETTDTASETANTAATTRELPRTKIIPDLAHVGQTFNNCSSVGLLIALSRWGIRESQERIAEATRPWNNPKGDNDDKSVTLYELADYAKEEHGMLAYVRPNGDIELLKRFVANDIPVLTRALTYADKDYVHYRIIYGYDDEAEVVFDSDGIEGPKVRYSYDKWMHLWKDFNYSYVIVVPPEKRLLVEKLLGEEADEKVAWRNAAKRAEAEIAKDPNDMRAHFNLVTALYYLGDYEGTVREFEKIETRLTAHKLWYQMEPIEAYFKLGNYDRVIELADSVINANNRSVSELYFLKGKIYESRGDNAAARTEYEKAVLYHKYYQPAKDALTALK